MKDDLHPGDSSGNLSAIARGKHSHIQDTVAIDEPGEKIVVAVPGDSIVSLNISSDQVAEYALDVGPTRDTEFTEEELYSGSEISDTFQLGDLYLSIRVTSTAPIGSEATITIQESR